MNSPPFPSHLPTVWFLSESQCDKIYRWALSKCRPYYFNHCLSLTGLVPFFNDVWFSAHISLMCVGKNIVKWRISLYSKPKRNWSERRRRMLCILWGLVAVSCLVRRTLEIIESIERWACLPFFHCLDPVSILAVLKFSVRHWWPSTNGDSGIYDLFRCNKTI